MTLHSRRIITKTDVVVLALIIAIGIIKLPHPFHGDQALFNLGALKLSHGGILYRDFWDTKQPGIYFFYLIAGTLFGFDEVGVHLFELLYMVALGLVLSKGLKKYFQNSSVASLIPLFTVGMYYMVADTWHLTQVEALVGFPLFLSLWFISEAQHFQKNSYLMFFLSGFMGSIVLLFKFMFLPILAIFWLIFVIQIIVNKEKRNFVPFIKANIWIIIGLLVPLLTVLCYFAWNKSLMILVKTFFVYPPLMIEETQGPGIWRLIDGLKWFIFHFAPVIALAVIGSYISLTSRRDFIKVNLILWIITGFGVILIQRLSWYEYHYFLLFIPFGILACFALDLFWSNLKSVEPSGVSWKGIVAVIMSLVVLFSPLLAPYAKRGFQLVHDVVIQKDLRKYQSRYSKTYADILSDVQFLSKPGSLSGDIYVCGDPRIIFLSGRGQAIPINGWALEIYVPELWEILTKQLIESLPPYIFVDNFYRPIIEKKSQKLFNFIKNNYKMTSKNEEGVWYVRLKNL